MSAAITGLVQYVLYGSSVYDITPTPHNKQ